MCAIGKLSIRVDVFRFMCAVTIAILSKCLSKKIAFINIKIITDKYGQEIVIPAPLTHVNFHTHTHKEN